ncbi:hypothetical protein [Corynebacterium tapiri]|uniref:Uncharacterized protein n=1 Tax=Corynebacterium tapiri TaxID=1448266 RepID=A0A5C4U1U3_9CORY|nr:hypothetical protein [Corynebacterium tapiri]TNL95645.1 hypothetical protein FHE74_09385 [Corynebacterium tapiri]
MSEQQEKKKRGQVKAWHIVFLAIAVASTIALAWWQWTRFQSGSGSFQNLGYALQWPLFGAFFVYAYRMGMKYEREAAEAAEDNPDALYEADAQRFDSQPTEIDQDFLPERPQIDIEEFNRLNTPRRGSQS